ncbi:MAG: ABC transporter permease, partial [Saprospiraceae bacterium]|nr:ABC transporter permease [Saprospiraceae bacterium]
MLSHAIKMLLRKQPVFTGLNMTGLVIGMTACLLLFNYIRYEQQYDRNTPHASQIWRVFNKTMDGESVITQDANTHSAVGP